MVSCSVWGTLEIETTALSSLGQVSGLDISCSSERVISVAGFREQLNWPSSVVAGNPGGLNRSMQRSFAGGPNRDGVSFGQ